MDPGYKRKCSPELSRVQRAQWFEISALKSPGEVEESQRYVLELKPFASFPHVSFDTVEVGTSKICILYIKNPLDVPQTIQIEKFPFDKGFDISVKQISVPPLQEQGVEIIWKPEKSVSCRETVFFKTSYGAKTQAYLHGIAVSPKREKKRKTWHPKKNSHAALDKLFKERDPIKSGFEEKKENLDFSCNWQDFSKQSNPNSDLVDSSFRRQTYTINSMFKESRRDTGAFRLPITKDELSSKRKETFVLSDITSAPLRELDMEFNLPESTKKKFVSDIVNDSLEDSIFETAQNPPVAVSCSSIHSLDFVPKVNVMDLIDENTISSGVTNNVKQFQALEEIAGESIFDFTIDRMGMSRYLSDYKTAVLQGRSDVKSLADELGEVRSNCINNNSTLNSFSIHDKPFLPEENVNDKIEINLANVFSNTTSSSSNQICNQGCSIGEPSLFIQKNDTFVDNNSVLKPSSLEPALGISDTFASCDALNKNGYSQETNQSVRSSTCFEIPCDFNEKSNVRANNMGKKKTRSPPKASAFSKKHPKKSPLKVKLQKFKSPVMRRNIKNKDNNKPSECASDVQQSIRNVSRCLSLRKEKLLEKMCQKNPFASVNAYYDEYWMEKQETAFKNWINFILTPNDDFIPSEDVKVNSAQVWIESMKDCAQNPAPSKEELSYKTYTAAHQLNQLRKSAFSLYQSDNLAVVIKKIEKEVDLKKIVVRKDRALHADLGIKKDLLKMLLSYNPLWLRIGLETVYGEIICLKNSRDILGLSRFIIFRFLSNPELVAKFTHPLTPNYFKPGYEEEIKRFMLKKFLLLVYFLDIAKNTRLIDYNPCLFNKSSEYKSSRDLLLNFSKEYLSGEGDLTKHLRLLGYIVTYQQMPIEEFDYAVRNIAVDLRCGLRLGKVLELLLHEWSIPNTLRVNTINRVNKIYNNDVILKALKKVSIEIEGNIDARDIVDGNREKTLSLLWQIIFKTQISKLLDKDMLIKENAYLKRLLRLKADYAAFSALEEIKSTSGDLEISFTDSNLYEENEILKLLLQWCQYVCAQYKLKVQNFTSSFSDGQALCLLLHHYHPNIIPYERIKQETTTTFVAKVMECDETHSSPFMSENDKLSMEEKRGLIQNEKANWELAFSKLHEIGQIPILSFPTNVSNRLPDEKVMIIMVSYINIRLMELSSEIRAARTIQLAYRRWKLEEKLKKLRVEIVAARVIQKAWKNHLAYKRKQIEDTAAIIIQCSWRMYSAKKKLQYLKYSKTREFFSSKAIIIQAVYRGYAVRKQIAILNAAAIVIQKNIRMAIVKTQFSRLKKTTLKIQRIFRAKVIGSIQRQKYLHLRNMVLKLQALSRGMILRKTLLKKEAAASVIQSYIRMYIARRQFLKIKKSSIVIQKRFRSNLLTRQCSQDFKCIRNASILIQKWYRHIQSERLKKQSATKIQAVVRKYIQRKQYLIMKSAALKIQLWWKAKLLGRKCRSSYLQKKKQIVLLQSATRCFIAQKKFQRQMQSVIKIQKNARKMIARKKFKSMKNSAVKIQIWWRAKLHGKNTRSSYLITRKHIILLQSLVRRFIARKSYTSKKQAAIIIQKNVCSYLVRKKFCQKKASASKIQSWWRARLLGQETRASYLSFRKKVVFTQAIARGWIARKLYKRKKYSAIVIQKCLRRQIAQKKFCTIKQNTIKLQRWWKNLLIGRAVRQKYLMCLQSVVKIQSIYRMHRAKKSYKELKKTVLFVELCWSGKKQRREFLHCKRSITIIQASYRAYRCKKQFLALKSAALTIQSAFRRKKTQKYYLKLKKSTIIIQDYYRQYRKMCSDRETFLKIKAGITKLQAVCRGERTRKRIQNLHEKAITIQRYIKMWILRRRYLKLKKSCILIQQKYRSNQKMVKDLRKYQNLKTATILIQSYVRKHQACRQYKTIKTAAIKLQSFARMIKSRKKYYTTRRLIIRVQQIYRAKRLMVARRLDYIAKKNAAIVLQSRIRGHLARKNFQKLRSACIVLQSAFRSRKDRSSYLRLKSATIKIQKRFRELKAGKAARSNFELIRKACIKVQSYVRMVKQRNNYKKIRASAAVIQNRYRSLCIARNERQMFLKMKQSCIIIQSFMRMKLAQRCFIKVRKASIVIQSFFRMYIARKLFTNIKNSVKVLQVHLIAWKLGRNERSKYAISKKSAILIQSVFRSYAARKAYKAKVRACIKIQSKFRAYICYKEYKRLRDSTVVLQKYIHAFLRGRKARKDFFHNRELIIKTQALVRGWLVRKHVKSLTVSATKIQAYYRGYHCRKKYLSQRKSAIVLQKYIKSHLKGLKVRHQYIIMKQSAIIIQSLWRGRTARQKLSKQKSAAIKIQSFMRSILIRRRFLKLKRSVQVIECHYSALKIARKQHYFFHLKKKSCIKIQSWWRKCLVIKQKEKEINAAILIQKSFRKYKLYQANLNLKGLNGLTAHQQRRWYINLRTNIVEFQRSARLYIAKREKAAIVIQSFFRRYLTQKREKREKGAVKIQALWRGYCVRRRITNKMLLNIRKNINAVSDEYHSLISRTNRAVDILQCNGNIPKILKALENLDTCTKLSWNCCIRFEQSGGLSRLITFIKMCNRSVPHREILSYCMSILLNVAKYDKTVASVWQQKTIVETTLNLMKVWAKDCDIFNKCCCLLYIFCQDPEKAEILKSDSAFTSQVEGLYKEVIRRYTSLSSQSAKMPRKSTLNLDMRERMHIEPEWLLGKHRKRTFKDPVTAITSLMRSLDLKTNDISLRK